MDLLIILTYVAFCVAIFKIFRIPLNKWTVPTAILGGIAVLATLLLLMNYNHPYAKYTKEVFISVPIVPNARGPVISVDVTPNQPVSQGDVLFRIDPVPYELEVIRKRAQLSAAGQGDMAQEEAWKAARGQLQQARAARDRAKIALDRAEASAIAFSAQELDNRRAQYASAEAAVNVAEANVNQARIRMDTELDGEDAQVAQLRAELRRAEYDLENTIVRAPGDGMVTQLALSPGMIAVPMPLRPTMVFIPNQRRTVVASVWQNSMSRIEPGQEAEMIFDAVPGHVFKGVVRELLPAMAEGEIQSGGRLIPASAVAQRGRALAVIELEENLDDYNLPRGVQGAGAIYTDHFSHVSIIRRVLLRMMGWLNYVYPIK